MKMTATALSALLLVAAPAWAQQADAFRNDMPETRAAPGGAGAAGSADEARQGESLQPLPPQAAQALARLSRNAVAAQQYGNLAASKQAPAVVRDLGDRMVVVNSEINQRLDQLAARHGTQLPQQMSEQQQQFMEALADTNRDEFGRGLTAWVTETYPQSIRALEQVSQLPGFEDLARTALPRLREQLQVSQQVAQAYMQGGPVQAEMPAEGGRRGAEPQRGSQLFEGGPGQGELAVGNPGGLLAAMANVDTEIQQLGMTSDLQPEEVTVVPAQQALRPTDMEVVQDSIRRNRSGIDRLQQTVANEDALDQALRGSNASPGDVIAMDVLDDGVVLYTMGPQQAETPVR